MAQTTKLSQMPIQRVVERTSLVPILYRGINVTTELGSIADLVTKESLDLDRVQNLSPDEMPISTATAQALVRKMDVDAQIPVQQITGLTALLDTKLDKDGVIEQNQVVGLVPRLEALENAEIPISRVTGLEQRLVAIESDPISVDRIDGLDAAVNLVIDGRTDIHPTVIKGATGW